MAVGDYLLKIDGIEGESNDTKHKGEIEIESFSWGATNSGSSPGGSGGGTGKVNMQDFNFTMKVNKASPKLKLACASGQHIPSAVLTARKQGGDQQEYLIWKFTDLVISSYQHGGSSSSNTIPMDQVSFNFTQVEMSYSPQKKDGTLDAPVKAGWNVKNNAKV